MKYRTACAALALLLLPLTAPSALAANAHVADGGAKVRSGPGFHYQVIGRLRSGTSINVRTCTASGQWCRISAYGRRGWVAASRLAIDYVGRPGDGKPVMGGRAGGHGHTHADGTNGHSNYVRILGIVVDKPGYCYALSHSGDSIIVRCP